MSRHHTLMTGLADMLANVRDIRELNENDADDPRYLAYWRWLDGLSTSELQRERTAAPLDTNRVRGTVRLNACKCHLQMRTYMDMLNLVRWDRSVRP